MSAFYECFLDLAVVLVILNDLSDLDLTLVSRMEMTVGRQIKTAKRLKLTIGSSALTTSYYTIIIRGKVIASVTQNIAKLYNNNKA